MVFFIVIGIALNQCEKNIYQQTMYVQASGGLRMRNAPNIKASRLTTIPNGAKISVLKEYGRTIELSGKRGKWVKITYHGQEGWVFGGFLHQSHSAGQNSKEDELTQIKGLYFSSGEVEPGHMSDWLGIDSSTVVYGYGGNVNPAWYCLIKKISRSGKIFKIECDSSRTPTSKEVPNLYAPEAVSKKSIKIRILDSKNIAIGDEKFYRRNL